MPLHRLMLHLSTILNYMNGGTMFNFVNVFLTSTVVAEHVNHLMQGGIEVCEEHECLPSIYWLPKLHT